MRQTGRTGEAGLVQAGGGRGLCFENQKDGGLQRIKTGLKEGMCLGFRASGTAWKSTGEKRAGGRERGPVPGGRGVQVLGCGVWDG